MLHLFDKKNLSAMVSILILLSGCKLSLHAQSNVRLTNIWDNLYSINPSYINNKYKGTIHLATKKQLLGFTGASSLYLFNGTLMLDKLNTQVGIKASDDVIGYTHSTSLSLSYAYAVNLNEDWRLHLGIAGVYQNLWYDMAKIRAESTTDPLIYEKLTRANYYNADMGAELASQSWRIGASLKNAFSLFGKTSDGLVNTNFAYATYRNVNDDSHIDYGGGICAIQNKNLYQMEMSCSAYFKNNNLEDLFQAGVFFRTPNEMGVICGFNMSKSIYLSYSYDFNVSGINRNASGTHELMLVIHFNKQTVCNTCY